MVWVLAFDRLTVKAKAVVPGGVLLVGSAEHTSELQSRDHCVCRLWLVHMPTGLAIVALVAPDRVTVKVSSGSNAVSAHTCTVIGLLVSPGANVSVVLLWLLYSGVPPSLQIYTLSLHDALPILA